MKERIDELTMQAIEHHDDGCAKEFYARLRDHRRLFTTRCAKCARVSYPPRPFCPACFAHTIEWVDVTDRPATLYAFTTQERALRFMAPDVIGVVELGSVGRIVSKIEAPFAALAIGQRLVFRPFVISADLVIPSFGPEG